jgi:hypothetical protein
MESYRARKVPGGIAANTQVTTEQPAVLNAWQNLIANFEAELNDGQATFTQETTVQQTVEQEFSTYVMGARSSGTTLDTLKFWQVSITP